MAGTFGTSVCPLLGQMGKASSIQKLYDAVVTVKAGNSEKVVHRGLICHYSEYFRGAFEGGVKESEGVVTLADEDEEGFRAFFYWLYKGRIVEDPSKFDLAKDAFQLAKIYVFGDARGIPVLKNAALDLFIARRAVKQWIPTDIIKYLYENTPDNDNFRKLFVDLFAYCPVVRPRLLCTPNEKSKYTFDFLFDIFAATVGRENKKKPEVTQEVLNSNKCRYHDHTDINAPGEPKPVGPASTSAESATSNSFGSPGKFTGFGRGGTGLGRGGL